MKKVLILIFAALYVVNAKSQDLLNKDFTDFRLKISEAVIGDDTLKDGVLSNIDNKVDASWVNEQGFLKIESDPKYIADSSYIKSSIKDFVADSSKYVTYTGNDQDLDLGVKSITFGKNISNYIDNTYATNRPVIYDYNITISPTNLPSIPVDYHGIDLQMTAVGNINNNIGLYPFETIAENNSTGTIKRLVPAYSLALNSGSGGVDEVVNYQAWLKNTGSSNINTYKGILIYNPTNTGGGSIANLFGIYIENLTGASTNNYGIYSLANNYFDKSTINTELRLPYLTDNYLPYKTSAGIQNSGYYWDATTGKGAIGTTVPRARFTVYGAAAADYPTLGTSNGSMTVQSGTNSFGLDIGVKDNGNSWMQAHRFNGTSTAYNLILQPSGGNVGIGTTTPAAKLDVNGAVRIANDATAASSTNVGAIRYRVSGSTSYCEMVMQTGASTYSWVVIKSNTW